MLVVDDEGSVRDFLRAFFQARFAVTTVANAAEALRALLEGERFDILVIDKNMPGMSGVELIRQIREADDDVAIAMITGYASAESIVETLNLGIDAYIEKPFKSLTEFGALVDSILARRKKTPEAVREAAREARVVGAIGDFDQRVEVAAALATLPAKVTCVGTELELVDLLDPEPDIVLLDTVAWRGWTPKIVETIAERAPFAACVVLSSGNLSTDALKALVDLGVVAVLMWHEDPDWQKKLLESARRVLAPAG